MNEAAETKTQTLTDTLRELSELLPERFRNDVRNDILGVVVGPVVRWIVNDLDEPWVLIACLEECEARGWQWSIWSVAVSGPLWTCIIYGPPGNPIGQSEDSPAMALATALRDALESQR